MQHHTTLCEYIAGYVDKAELVPNTKKIVVAGWCFANQTETTDFEMRVVTSSGQLFPLTKFDRDDVAAAYGTESVTNCGFEFFGDASDSHTVEAYINDFWQAVFALPAQYDALGILPFQAPLLVVLEQFYADPLGVRALALQQTFEENTAYFRGCRTSKTFRPLHVKRQFEFALGCTITNWDTYDANGVFQYCKAGDQLVYHVDLQQYAAIIFLTPNAPPQTGTNLYRSVATKRSDVPSDDTPIVFRNGHYDRTAFELVDSIGNVFNRAIIFNAQRIHAAAEYFGNALDNGRLFHMFFFDIETD